MRPFWWLSNTVMCYKMHFKNVLKMNKRSVLPGSLVWFLLSSGIGQSGPQFPHFPCPPTWCPESSTKVEHQALCSVRWAMSHMQVVCVTPLKRNGKMHGKLGAAPLTVVHTFFSSLEPEPEPSEKLKKKRFFNYSISKVHIHMVTCNFLLMHLKRLINVSFCKECTLG